VTKRLKKRSRGLESWQSWGGVGEGFMTKSRKKVTMSCIFYQEKKNTKVGGGGGKLKKGEKGTAEIWRRKKQNLFPEKRSSLGKETGGIISGPK